MIHITLKGQVYRLSFSVETCPVLLYNGAGETFAVRLPPGREVMLVTVYEALTLMVAFSALVVCIISTKNK